MRANVWVTPSSSSTIRIFNASRSVTTPDMATIVADATQPDFARLHAIARASSWQALEWAVELAAKPC